MGNVNGREEGGVGGGGGDDPAIRANGDDAVRENHAPRSGVPSSDLMANSPPDSPQRCRSPVLFAPQVPAVPLQGDYPPFFNHMPQDEPEDDTEYPPEQGIPILITWSYGGKNVAVEGSWDSWRTRKILQRTGKDHTILLVLPSGIYHYKFIVDGEERYIPDLPHETDERGRTCNLLDVNDYVPENPESIAEFEAPPSPDSSYGQAFPRDEEYAKEPMVAPPQLNPTVGGENSDEASSSSSSLKPQHVVLNHLFTEKGWASQSVVALGLTHRFHSKPAVCCKENFFIQQGKVVLTAANLRFGCTIFLEFQWCLQTLNYGDYVLCLFILLP